MRKGITVAWAALGVVLMIVGLGGLPDDLQGWASFLNTLGYDVVRWVVVLLGLAVIATVAIPRLRFWEARQEEEDTPQNEGRPNWLIELEWMGDYGISGLDGIRIRPHSTDGSTARIYLCEVTGTRWRGGRRKRPRGWECHIR